MAEFFTSDFWEAIVLAVIAITAALLTVWLGFRDLRLRRRLETSRQFLALFSTAHGRPTDGRDAVGLGEQVATLHLIADFAKSEGLLKNAARNGLEHFTTWDQVEKPNEQQIAIANAAREAKGRL